MERGAVVFVCYTRNLLDRESDLEQTIEVKQHRIGAAWVIAGRRSRLRDDSLPLTRHRGLAVLHEVEHGILDTIRREPEIDTSTSASTAAVAQSVSLCLPRRLFGSEQT